MITFMIQMLPNRTELGNVFPTLVYQALLDPPKTRVNRVRDALPLSFQVNDFALRATRRHDGTTARGSV